MLELLESLLRTGLDPAFPHYREAAPAPCADRIEAQARGRDMKMNLTIILPFYMNQDMLVRQFEEINEYPREIRERLQLIVVDDCSPTGERADEIIKKEKLKAKIADFRLYRILTDLRWNQNQCRNLGAREATSEWLLLTDIDHLIPTDTIQSIFRTELSSTDFHTFGRKKYDGSDYKEHPNSYLMTKDLYWLIGGYDETFCGHYGTDSMYRRRAEKYAGRIHHADWKLVNVGRNDIPDASTRTLKRKEGRDTSFRESIPKYKHREGIKEVQILKLPWERLYL